MGYYDASKTEAVGMGQAIHAGRQFLSRRLRRLVPQSYLSGLRLRAALRQCACGHRRQARRQRQSGRCRVRPITPDGYAVNTMQPVSQPHAPVTDQTKLLPAPGHDDDRRRAEREGRHLGLVFGRLERRVAGHPDKLFQFHHQPFAYFKKYADGTKERAEHLKDEADLEKAIADGSLPAVVVLQADRRAERAPGLCRDHGRRRPCRRHPDPIEKSPAWTGHGRHHHL